jgi:glycosyltransferase involved in cell wall biosynthesis
MRIGVVTVQVPFISGGAEILTNGLVKAIREAGHEAEEISMPFRFAPVSEVKRSMDIWASENFEYMNGYTMDIVICLKFPTFYLQHPNKVAWIIHQHRAVYDLWDTTFTEGLSKTSEGQSLRQEIIQNDQQALKSFNKVFTIGKTVSRRLQHFNQISSVTLYHPPKLYGQFYTSPAEPYIFFPSRLEELKRQHLLIKAMKYVKSPVLALIAGDGGQKIALQNLIEQLDINHRVRLIGRLSDAEMLGFYAHSLGVFFGSYDEDYGYVTLEAMLAAKPVITCTDSGEAVEFVVNKETGFIVQPEPEAIAQAIDNLYFHQQRATEMGMAGLERYRTLDISWENVINQLIHT